MLPPPARRIVLLATLLAGLAAPARALCRESHCAPDGRQTSGAVYRVCMPEPGCWNGDVVVFAHAYVEGAQPVAIPEQQLEFADGVSLPGLLNQLGYAFAVTSYSGNGLAIQEGIADVVDLARVFADLHGAPGHTYLVGFSEGSLVTALALEREPEAFAAGLAACGPLGDFQASIDYASDVRVVFDYLFPGVIPGSVADVPATVRQDWTAVYGPGVRQALAGDSARLAELLAVTRVAVHPEGPASWTEALALVLWFATFASADAVVRLGGHPYGNQFRVYRGSSDDAALNRGVGRHAADREVRAEIAARYEASGKLARPLVTLHTRLDPTVPYRQATLFARKVRAEGAAPLHRHVPVRRFGHCAFQAVDGLIAFATMIHLAGGALSPELAPVLHDRAAGERLARRMGAAVPDP